MATTINFSIVDNKIAEFKLGFLKFRPNIELNGGGSLKYTDAQWIKEWGKRQYMWAYKNGKSTLALEASTAQTDLIT